MSPFLASLSPFLWWDLDASALDEQAHAAQIIERIAMRGTLNDFTKMMRHYPKSLIIEKLTQARYLDPLTLNYCAIIFEQPKSAFRCYIEQPSKPGLFSY
ncbi:MAG: hypothetical protein KJS92_07520 [Bacteroidetes bacterium]|nr:hypothetical protein [Bacteroidota bacterium]